MRLRIIPPLETWPRLVAFVEQPLGKLCVLGVFAVAMLLLGEGRVIELTAILALLSFFPERRRQLMVIGTLYWVASASAPRLEAVVADVAAREGVSEAFAWSEIRLVAQGCALLFCAGYYALARRFRGRGPMKRPVATLLGLFGAGLFVASYAPMGGGARVLCWAFLAGLSLYIWFLGYSLLDLASKQTPAFGMQLGHYLPFWGSSPTPFPKGAAYLRKIEAKDARQLAVAQIKGVKLILWALCLSGARRAWQLVVHGDYGRLGALLEAVVGFRVSFDLPRLDPLLQSWGSGEVVAWHLGWVVLVANFLGHLLAIAIWGHVIIAGCRMAGFCALRNTCSPLASQSIAEFWNRYYYYFKELLVDFFYYPAFLRYFRAHPVLRRGFATLAAASFGNILYHFIRDIDRIAALGAWEALRVFQAYVLYGLVLGLGIAISQERTARRAKAGVTASPLARFASPLLITGFFCLLSIFDRPGASPPLDTQLAFLMTLVGMG